MSIRNVPTKAGEHPRYLPWVDRAALGHAALFVAPFAIAFAVYLGAFLVMRPAATGDEPHYFLIAESLIYDGDVDLRNDYASRKRTLAVCQCFPLVHKGDLPAGRHAFHYTSSHALYPTHGLGLPVLIAPAVGLGGLTLVRLFMVFIGALMADQLYRLLAQLNVARGWSRWLAWAAVVFCLPLLAFSNQILTEIPGALLTLVALRVIVAQNPRWAAVLTGALAGAALPWLQTRYLSLSLFVLIALLYVLGRARGGENALASSASGSLAERARNEARSLRTNLAHRRREVGLAVVLPYLVSLGLLAGIFKVLYGSPLPDAPYRPLGFGTIGSGGWKFWYDWFLDDVFDPGIGWIPYSPVQWLGLAGIVCLYKRVGWRALVGAGAALAYALLVASTGVPAGTGFPARYLVTVIPIIAVPLALVIDTVREARIAFVPLLAVSGVFAVGAVLDYQSLYPFIRERHEEARLFGVRSIQTAFPRPLVYALANSAVDRPGDFQPQTGSIRNGRVIASSSRGDRPGYVLWGPYATLRRGSYRATFSIGARGPDRNEVARIEVASGNSLLAQRGVTPVNVARPPKLTKLVLPFTTSGGLQIETRVFYEGRGEVDAGAAEISPGRETARAFPQVTFSDWPLVVVWVAGTALVATLFARVMREPDVKPRSAV